MSEQKLTSLGKAMAKQMARSWEAPQFQLYTTVRCGGLIARRESLDYRPSYTTLLAKLTADVLKDFPLLNASWADGTKVELNESVNMGIAVDTPRGLLVPVIPDAQAKTLEEIHQEMQAIKGKKGMFSLADLTGGTFVISNLGIFNVTMFSAIVNAPNAAILSVGKMMDTPVWRDGAFACEKTMNLGLCLDHRIVDGATGAKFLTALVERLENPQ